VQGLGGLKQDESEAARLFRLAADQGYPNAQYNLRFFYENGAGGLAKDTREAERLYRLAAEGGFADAQAALARLRASR
jgi:TPR repeat protein